MAIVDVKFLISLKNKHFIFQHSQSKNDPRPIAFHSHLNLSPLNDS